MNQAHLVIRVCKYELHLDAFKSKAKEEMRNVDVVWLEFVARARVLPVGDQEWIVARGVEVELAAMAVPLRCVRSLANLAWGGRAGQNVGRESQNERRRTVVVHARSRSDLVHWKVDVEVVGDRCYGIKGQGVDGDAEAVLEELARL